MRTESGVRPGRSGGSVARLLLAAASGGSLALAFPPVGWWPAALAGWIPFLLAVRGAGARAGFRLGALQGLLLHGIALSWLWNLFGARAPALWLLLAFFHAVAGGAIGAGRARAAPGRGSPILAAVLLGGIEFYRSEWFPLRFPWITPGTALGPTWLSPLVGVYGTSFLVYLAAAGLALGRTRARLASSALLALLLASGLLRPGPVPLPEEGAVRVLCVQSERLELGACLGPTRSWGGRDAVVVWPEYALPVVGAGGEAEAYGAVEALCRERELVAVLGAPRTDEEGVLFNEALVCGPSGFLGRHRKNRPVHFLSDGKPGQEAKPVATPQGRIGTPICFDCDYEAIVRRMTAAGAEWFAVPSLDAMRWGRTQHLQHAEHFPLRAAENGRWMAVAATSGRTQILDPHGRRRGEIPLFEEGVLEGLVGRGTRLTFYTRAGHAVGPALCFGAASRILLLLVLSRRAK